MKKQILVFFLLIFIDSYGQTGIYHSNGTLTVEIPTSFDVLYGYPNANQIDSKAIDEYNKGTTIIINLNKQTNKENSLLKAIDHFISSINYDKKFVQAYDNLGKSYRMLGNYNLAKESYEISIKIFPSGISAHQNLAIIYEKEKDWRNAIFRYKTVIKLQPNNPEGYYGLANVYMKTSEYEIALKNASKALELYKKNPTNYIGDSYGQVGLIYYYTKNNIKAKEYIQIAKEKYISNNLKSYFYSTFPKNMLKELGIR